MPNVLDTALQAALSFGRASDAELLEAYSAIPAETRQRITQRDIELRARTAVGDGVVDLNRLMAAPASDKLEVLKVADDTLDAMKAHYQNFFDRPAQFWPPDAATAEVADFLAVHGCSNLAGIARAAATMQPPPPKGPSSNGPDALTP